MYYKWEGGGGAGGRVRRHKKPPIGRPGGGRDVVGGCRGQNVLFMHARILTCFAKNISTAQRWTKDANRKQDRQNNAQKRPAFNFL